MKIINIFRPPSAMQLAQRELEQAERSLVNAETNALYYAKMAEYHKDQISILKRYSQPQQTKVVGFP
jgi:hypothetical protein